MNRRQKKKMAKKRELFVTSFAESYREVRELDRSYHEFVLDSRRKQRCGHYLLDNLEWDDKTGTWCNQNNVTKSSTFKF